ncbi:MAG: diacylglycerol kinase family lipid kinase [Candidatus Aminicenantes bacterium]|nr:diacylglycerol kinase family lipid kinase [Candidatus Aminicenantes bacterium]
MFPKTQVIVNPESNKGQTRKKWREIREALKHFIRDFKYEFTEFPFQAAEISRSAIKEGSELIIGVGGDGTINEIANGFYENTRIINPNSVLGIVPSGTGCDLIKSLNVPRGLSNALKTLTEAPSSLIDVGRVTFRDNTGHLTERFFLNVADFGIGGEVVKNVTDSRMKRKASSYLKCLLSTVLSFTNKKVQITIDGRSLDLEEYMIGAVSNGRVFGKGMKIAPKAKIDDGFFDFILVKGMKLFEFFRNVWRIYAGTHLSHPKISFIKGKKITADPVDLKEPVLLELDGDQLGRLPAVFDIVPRSILVKGYI